MLTPDQVKAIEEELAKLTNPVLEYLLQDIARRVAGAGQLTSTAAYQIYKAQQLGMSRRQIQVFLRRHLKVSHQELRKLLTQTAEVGYRFDLEQLPTKQATPFAENKSLQQLLEATIKQANRDYTNLVQTLGMVAPDGKAYPLRKVYQQTMDFAFKQVSTGAADYNTAIRQATRALADRGLRVIDYESGVHTSLEAAVRRNIMGGLGLMQEQISQQAHDDMGADGWEISAHANSAPDHEPIQGKQYSDAEYKALNNSLARRIGTLNCGHGAFPIILGVSNPQYTPEELEQFRKSNAEGVAVDGKHYTGYEATQKQRQIERAIRRQKNQVLVSEAASDKERLTSSQIRLTRLNQEYKRFSKAVGLRTQLERAQVAGFGRGEAARASGAAKRASGEDTRLYYLAETRRNRLEQHPELALLRAEEVVIQQDKFVKYLFNPQNPIGFAKGVAFTSRLGYNIDNWEELRREIARCAPLYPVRQVGDRGHGMKYEQKVILFGRTGRPANVVVSWIEEDGIPRMTSAYIKEVKELDD